MSAEDVEIAVIQPLLATFPPPTHLRGSPRAIDMALAVYRRSLERFERPVLDQAWHQAAAENEFRIWPTCRSILKAAEHFNALLHPPAKTSDAWVEKALGMADAYTSRFLKTSLTAVKAREGGYERQLKEYILEASWVQAQALIGRKALSYTSLVLFQNGETREEREEWFERARKQAASGHIRVSVPGELMKKWKGQAEGRERSR